MVDKYLQDWVAAEAIKEAQPCCAVHDYQWEPRLLGGEVQRCKVCGFHLDSSWRRRSDPDTRAEHES